MAVVFKIDNAPDISALLTVSGSADTITVTSKGPNRGFMCEMKATAALTYKAYAADTPVPENSARLVTDVAESIYVPPSGLIIQVSGTGSVYIRAIVGA